MSETLALVVLAAGVVALVVGVVLLQRSLRASTSLANEVVNNIEPYLRRSAAEAGIDTERPVWTGRHSPAEKIKYSARLARNLNDNERGRASRTTSSTALAQTMPLADSREITAPRHIGDKNDDVDKNGDGDKNVDKVGDNDITAPRKLGDR